jgi:hypothetical protein
MAGCSDQLALDLEPPLTMVTRCEKCGVGWAVPVEAGETWQPAILFGLVELERHRREIHPVTDR